MLGFVPVRSVWGAGDPVLKGQPLFSLHADTKGELDYAGSILHDPHEVIVL